MLSYVSEKMQLVWKFQQENNPKHKTKVAKRECQRNGKVATVQLTSSTSQCNYGDIIYIVRDFMARGFVEVSASEERSLSGLTCATYYSGQIKEHKFGVRFMEGETD
ncbi:PREDICTED: uncharacterized protein LOC108971610 [Bactrocera latifrons]|uniref:uncharacterized protein LOC108971610 n=1 Tax=Bactrocera latifrons TaxID=174628 RepID=UPI0008DE7868|nr:PREDICTED: uncharacterized protein LOC108971610 [Bactrocera latifrons]